MRASDLGGLVGDGVRNETAGGLRRVGQQGPIVTEERLAGAAALDHPDVLLPSLLIIDSPRKAIGTVDQDRELGRRIYTRLATLAEAYKDRIQLVVADNDIPAELVTTHNTIVLTSERSAVPGVTNTGVGEGQRVEDL
ncbi:hypothetical protein [Nonomuraea sp. KM88]|uniref:hypothetical protein n=1 Tax=Nonomuraea sp. KM88 TaxID=3457427 RepID=UPI003FCDFF2C